MGNIGTVICIPALLIDQNSLIFNLSKKKKGKIMVYPKLLDVGGKRKRRDRVALGIPTNDLINYSHRSFPRMRVIVQEGNG